MILSKPTCFLLEEGKFEINKNYLLTTQHLVASFQPLIYFGLACHCNLIVFLKKFEFFLVLK
jgi:hypothetical protein